MFVGGGFGESDNDPRATALGLDSGGVSLLFVLLSPSPCCCFCDDVFIVVVVVVVIAADDDVTWLSSFSHRIMRPTWNVIILEKGMRHIFDYYKVTLIRRNKHKTKNKTLLL